MSIHNKSKINLLLQNWPHGAVLSTSTLEKQGISRLLLAKYKKSNWIESLGKGAFKRAGDPINWQGGVYAIQNQDTPLIHVGSLTAISLQRSGHYIRFKQAIQLFGQYKVTLPRWFKGYQWEEPIEYYNSNFLPYELALTPYCEKNFSIIISTLERAILECLYLAPHIIDLVECYQIIEGMTGLRPEILQELLEKCGSIKVKRLFMYMANKAKHDWLQFIDLKKINLGKGKRSIVKNGVYDAKYAITIPKELGEVE